MNPPPRSMDLALPLAALGLAAWQAFSSLIEAWRIDLYSRGAALAFAIWLAPAAYLFFKRRAAPSLSWIAISLFLSAAGSMSELRVLHHLALAAAFPGLFGLELGGIVMTAAATAWLPASGWFLSHVKTAGLAGWERPAFAACMALALLACHGIAVKPPHSRTKNP